MKLRIKGDSLRLRIAPSEMERLLESGRVEETVHFGAEEDARLTYALAHAADADSLKVDYEGGRVTVVVPSDQARAWASGEDVGVYGSVGVGSRELEIAVEKDWACLDKGEEDNRDTFPHPEQGAAC